jgi:hypothetical protein
MPFKKKTQKYRIVDKNVFGITEFLFYLWHNERFCVTIALSLKM